MGLFEREPELAMLRHEMGRLDEAGRVVTVTGDAGAGKTTLIRAATGPAGTDAARRPRLLRGLCDPLATPRPLGPIGDALGELDGRHAGAEAGVVARREPEASPITGEAGFVAAVAARPTVLVIEDAQWIDAASVEMLRYLVRRIDALPVLLVISFRDTVVGVGHPLQPLLGDIARLDTASSIALQPLSVAAVAAVLDGTDVDPGVAHAVTGGNPFYVGEIARHPDQRLPSTIRDAVLASASGLDDPDLETLQLIATAPDALDDRLLPVLGIDLPRLRRLEATGLIVRARRGIAFRHELARRAVLDSVGPGGGSLLHRRLLDALESLDSTDYAVLTHHAEAAGDDERTRRYAALAADVATRTGSHTEAVAFLELALAHVGDAGREATRSSTGGARDPRDDRDLDGLRRRAEMLELLSTEQYMVSRLPESIDSIDEALRLRERLGDRDGAAAAHDRRAVVEYYSARRRAAEHHAELAVAEADGAANGSSARATLAYLAYRRHDLVAARAILLEAAHEGDVRDDTPHDHTPHDHAARDGARGPGGSQDGPDGDPAAIRFAITEAAADLVEGEPSGRPRLLLRAAQALDRSLDEVGTTAFSNLAAIDIEHRRFREAEDVLARSIPLTIERDIPICYQWQTGMRARLHLLRGHWAASAEDAATILDAGSAPLASVWPNLVLALVALRTGGDDATVGEHLDAAWALALELGESLMILGTLAAIAERTWMSDVDDERLAESAARLDDAAALPGMEWAIGELAVWLARTGRPVDAAVFPRIAEPHRLELARRHDAAAQAWLALGSPFEASLSHLHGDDPDAAIAALVRLEEMGLDASAARARLLLADRGVEGVPAQRRASTRSNPSGLTNRQLDVARLVAKGLTNAELATTLYISPKTADHHVSAILAKLGLSNRREIGRRAAEFGID
ncbi:AAA family ATPase [Agromyces endophyticus]|uniref:helix-turn-helix transcriptional regulator n=1 Tax=Agromyces sp. H17E-10 TaxID=2932244 RepID=UPI001FD55D20|nr:LuxR family transcriptional regulator [Agromyces sp. H17E-10]UOQ91022.1 AAA family ATPase [Agromyces sp. H17E-10]